MNVRPHYTAISVTIIVLLAYLLACAGCSSNSDRGVDGASHRSEAHATGKLGALQYCLEARGWEVVYYGGSIESPVLPNEQVPLYHTDREQCVNETGFDDPYTAEDYHRLYPLEVANHQCLLNHGYDSAEPPSEQQFVDDWLVDSPDRRPYQSVDLVFQGDDYVAATHVCPPPLWGF